MLNTDPNEAIEYHRQEVQEVPLLIHTTQSH